LLGVFVVLCLVYFVQLIKLQVIDAGWLSEAAEAQRTSSITIEPRRGTIYDRNGVVLATSVDATTIYVDPSEVTDANMTASLLAEVLGGEAKDYLEKVTASNTLYSVIKRKADTSVGDQLSELATERVAQAQEKADEKAKASGEEAETVASGIHFVTESRREYPNGQVGGQIVGACNIGVDEENNREYYYGMCGLEAQYDDILSGTPGYEKAEYGRSGQRIPSAEYERVDAVDGQDIVVSIDIELQRQVEESLTSGCEGMNATGGSSVVMDGETGEIYAAASLPLFNPADRTEVKEGATSLKAVTNLFEPGSIFKSVSAMAILETGTLTPDSELYCPASITADGYTISDAHERGDATYSLRDILDQSSNVGISLATEKMGFQQLYDHIIKYNLHTRTGVDFPGEGEEGTDALGMLTDFDQWSAVQAYNVSFGQGVSVTPLQMVRFYGAIVNDGVECTPHFLISKPQSGETVTYETTKVIDNESAIADMQSMLKTVVTDGTGTKAAIDGYNVAGKTSTAEIYDEENGGYREGVYNLAFTGFIADSSSKLVCFVGANEVPGDGVVTPIFKDIMQTAIDRFRITSE
jgi:cell division protein FtsI (penicillin-binding protein 3)